VRRRVGLGRIAVLHDQILVIGGADPAAYRLAAPKRFAGLVALASLQIEIAEVVGRWASDIGLVRAGVVPVGLSVILECFVVLVAPSVRCPEAVADFPKPRSTDS